MKFHSVTFNISHVFTAPLVIIPLIFPSLSIAQIEEVIVTAQKREESIQNIPIAINALTGDMLDEMNIFDTDDIESVFVNLSTKDSSAANSGFAIRGVGTDSFHISGQQSVGTYIDNVYSVSPFVSTIGLYDMERIEVLRGPQNTLYGRNTTGGAVNFHSHKAEVGAGLNGYGRFRAGNGGLLNFESAIGADLGENMAGRIAVMTNNFDGVWTYRNTGEDAGAADKFGVRASLVWDIDNDTSLRLIYSHGEADGDDQIYRNDGPLSGDGTSPCPTFNTLTSNLQGSNNCAVAITPPQALADPTLAALFGAGALVPNPNPGPPLLFSPGLPEGEAWDVDGAGYDIEYDNINFYITHDFGEMQFDSITSYSISKLLQYATYDLTGFGSAQQGDWEVWQQELRLTSTGDGPLRWLAGFYYTTQQSQEDTWAVVAIAGVTNSILIDSDYDAWSIYGQLDYEIIDNVTLTGGLRYTDDSLEASRYDKWLCAPGSIPFSVANGQTFNREFRFANCTDISASLATRSPKQELSEIGWKVGVNWVAFDDLMLYASVSRGFKGGAYDNRALGFGTNPIDPEFLTAYEIGMKSSFLDHKIQLNLSAYFYIWEDLQLFEVVASVPSLTNIPETELKGFEAELKWTPVDNLYIQAALGLSDNEITDAAGVPAGSTAAEGKEITSAPDVTANVMAAYTIPMAMGELTLMTTYRHVGKYFLDLDNLPRSREQSRDYVNLRGTFAFGSELQHSISVWGNNLTGELGCNTLQNGPGVGQNFGCAIDGWGEVMYGVTLESRF